MILVILSRMEDKKILETVSLIKMDSEQTDLDIDFLLELNKARAISGMAFLMVEDRVHEAFLKAEEEWCVCIPFHVVSTCVFSIQISLETFYSILYTQME